MGKVGYKYSIDSLFPSTYFLAQNDSWPYAAHILVEETGTKLVNNLISTTYK